MLLTQVIYDRYFWICRSNFLIWNASIPFSPLMTRPANNKETEEKGKEAGNSSEFIRLDRKASYCRLLQRSRRYGRSKNTRRRWVVEAFQIYLPLVQTSTNGNGQHVVWMKHPGTILVQCYLGVWHIPKNYHNINIE